MIWDVSIYVFGQSLFDLSLFFGQLWINLFLTQTQLMLLLQSTRLSAVFTVRITAI